MAADGAFGEDELVGDLAVGQALGDEVEQLPLSGGETGTAPAGGSCALTGVVGQMRSQQAEQEFLPFGERSAIDTEQFEAVFATVVEPQRR